MIKMQKSAHPLGDSVGDRSLCVCVNALNFHAFLRHSPQFFRQCLAGAWGSLIRLFSVASKFLASGSVPFPLPALLSTSPPSVCYIFIFFSLLISDSVK